MRFKKIYLEIGNICNLSCSFCIKNSRESRQMTFEEFKHILSELKPYTKYLYFHVLGEPLLHQKLEIFLDYAHQEGFYVNLTTNGVLLRENLEMLCASEALRQINISVHNFKEHGKIDVNHYLNDIKECALELSKANKYVSLRLWNLRNNQIDDETSEIVNYFTSAFQVTQCIAKAHESMRLAEHLYLQFDEIFEWPSLGAPFTSKEGRCYGLKDMLAILVNGDVVPCCLDSKGEAVYGNLHEVSLKSILESEEMTLRMELRKNGIMSDALCQHCSFKKRF